jgi:plastocyanin
MTRLLPLVATLGAIAVALFLALPAIAATITVDAMPGNVNANVGDTVRWTEVPGHNVTSTSGNWSFVATNDAEFTFTAAGTYTFRCTIHSALGQVVVQQVAPTATNTPVPPTSTSLPTATSTPQSTSAGSLVSLLVGANETPTITTAAVGSVTLQLDAGAGTVNGTWSVANLGSNLTAAHIHRGVAGTNGSIVVNFGTLPSAGGSFTSATTGVSAALIQEILGAPAGFYVNVHTANNQSGEIRGQLVAGQVTRLIAPAAVKAGSVSTGDISAYPGAFHPKTFNARVGQTVRWVDTGTTHTVTSVTGLFNSDTIAPNGLTPGMEFSFTFTQAGTFPYYCRFHGSPDGTGHAGTVVVS